MISSGLKHKIKHLYEQNRRTHGEFSFTIPSSDTYPYQWLWDSCFAAITMSHFDVAQAKDELRSLAHHQFQNGMIPHMIYWQHTNGLPQLDMKWGTRNTSSITQPPLLAEAVNAIYDQDGDIAFVREMLPVIHRFHQFFYHERDPRHSKLVGIINPDESGEDTSPRFDHALDLPRQQSFEENYGARMELLKDWREARFIVKKRMDLKHWVRDVPFNAILLRSLHITARLAMLCGDQHIAHWSDMMADDVQDAMQAHLHHESGFYFSTMNYGDQERTITTSTWALFMPLYAELCTHEEAAQLVSLLSEPDYFAAQFGVPTVAISEDTFNLDSVWPWPNWRGPVWFAPHWFIIKGLRRYGYHEQADLILAQSMKLLQKSGFREFYNPFSGEGYGAKDFIWGGLILDMS